VAASCSSTPGPALQYCNTLLRYGWGVRSPLQNQMFQTDVRRVYAAKLMEALPLE
jgi:hypothetical protein